MELDWSIGHFLLTDILCSYPPVLDYNDDNNHGMSSYIVSSKYIFILTVIPCLSCFIII